MSDATSPGRRPPASALAQHDLLRRVQQLQLDETALPRVLRLVEAEVEAALERGLAQRYGEEELRAAGADDALLERLRAQRADTERAEALRAAGLHELPREELVALLSAARAERS